MSTHDIAKRIARGIFEVGNAVYPHLGDQVQRLQFMGGQWPDHETNLGGLDEKAFAQHIERLLNKHLPEQS